MHNLAIALKKQGYVVTGSDDEIFNPARKNLQSEGLLPPHTGWYPGKVTKSLDAVILGMHARKDNPELARALRLGIPVYSFPEFVYRETRDIPRAVIAGSHGKTTITAMLLYGLRAEGIPVSYLVGSAIRGFDLQVMFHPEAWLAVFEGDEYLSSPLDPRPKFLHYKPRYIVLTGIAWDHYNVFPTFENYLQAFRDFLTRCEPGGYLVYNKSDPEVARLAEEARHLNRIPYGPLNYQVVNGQFVVPYHGKAFPMHVFGRHNMENLGAALALAGKLGIHPEAFLTALSDFPGAGKRLETLAENDNAAVYLDFAHAPSKVKATIAAVKEKYPDRKLTAVLELHTYSSLNKDFLPQYKGIMKGATHRIVYYNPHALSLKKLSLSPADIRSAFGYDELQVFDDAEALRYYLQNLDWQEHNLLLMSSGNFGGLAIDEIANFVTSN